MDAIATHLAFLIYLSHSILHSSKLINWEEVALSPFFILPHFTTLQFKTKKPICVHYEGIPTYNISK